MEVIGPFNDQKIGFTDSKNPAGNFIAIKKDKTNFIILLAHLKQHSLLVQKGCLVKQGQPIGKVGNSGNTSEPHLHIQGIIEATGDWLVNAQGVPITFSNYFLIRNDLILSP